MLALEWNGKTQASMDAEVRHFRKMVEHALRSGTRAWRVNTDGTLGEVVWLRLPKTKFMNEVQSVRRCK